MAVGFSARLGIIIILSTTIFLYMLVPDMARTASSKLTKKISKKSACFRSVVEQKTICFAKSCFHLSSTSTGSFLETVFQLCLSKDIRNFLGERPKDEVVMHIVVVACGDRLEETLVSIKSSLLFTKKKIFYHIFAEEDLQPGFIDGINKWPEDFRKNLQFKLYQITYPKDGNEKNWKKLFKPCASQRLFLPMVLSEDVDSVLYVDTDILFLTDVTEIWSFFAKFNFTQLSALCIEHEDERMGWYNRFARHPYYGRTGVNSGVMLMNITRIRNAMYKNDLRPQRMTWKDMLQPLYNKYRYNITWGDQDLLNIIFHHNPEMLYVFSCEWNYRPDHCMYGQLCALAKERGVKIVHGCRRVFHNEKQPTFKAVYDSIKSYDFSKLEHLDQVMQRELKKAHNTYCGKEFECMLKGLKLAIQKA